MYKGAAPKFKEFGPYTYREYDSYDNLTWQDNENWQNGGAETAVNTTYNQWTEFKEDAVGNIDDKMYFVNQAAMGVWYQLRNADAWRTYITLLYSIVNDGLGRQVGDTAAFTTMKQMPFKDAESASQALCPTNKLSQEQADRIYNDPYYGLYDANNYYRWNGFLEDTIATENAAWRWECKTYFGLTFDQLDEMQANYRVYYNDQLDTATLLLPTPEEYRN